MRTCHGALFLAVAMVLLSTGICTAPAPGLGLDEFQLEYSPAPGPGLDELPPEYSCLKTLYSGGCDVKTCHDKCLSQLKGNGQCADKACRCSYLCKPPPLDI
ncbi:hypothetical protein PVAP13_1KG112048 [Panicum virgatum]|uniref:Uncharacterized protein n=1 Tax=Panicum virgatum TaxID=38727 RepID=A0A8T0XXR6_PANVG|nr:hypothetical protein PVAP13_1KG112048 [Panicum virgatum]